MRAISAQELRSFERRIREALQRLSLPLRGKVKDSSLRAANALFAHLQCVVNGEAGRESKSRFARIAATKLLPVLANADPLAVIIRLAALALYYDEDPKRFHGEDEVWRASLFHSFRRLVPVADRWTTYRTGKNVCKMKPTYKPIPERARHYASACLTETFSSHIALLRRVGREVSDLRHIEAAAVRDLTLEVAEEFRIKRELVRKVKDQMIYRRNKTKTLDGSTVQL